MLPDGPAPKEIVLTKENYDWNNGQDVVIYPTKGVAAYISDLGYLVIIQEGEDQDMKILINPDNLEAFALKINSLVGF